MLTSRRSPAVAAVRRLQAPSGRREAGAFLAEGPQAVREALGAGVVRELYVTAAARVAHPEFVAAAPVAIDVADDVLEAMGETRSPQGLVAVCGLLALRDALPDLSRGAVLLDRIGDPGNAGSIIRTADAAGYGAVVMTAGCVDPHNGKVVRASAGSVFHLPIAVDAEPAAVTRAAREAGLVVAGTTTAPEAIDLAEFAASLDGRGVAWWLGSEAHGLDPAILEMCDARVRIPIRGGAESLNVAAAAAVCMYAVAGVPMASWGPAPDASKGAAP